MAEHRLKVHPQFFEEVLEWRKKQEFRSTEDRDFKVGDVLVLVEFVPVPEKLLPESSIYPVYGITGREVRREITHILSHQDFAAVPEGWAILSMGEAPAVEGENEEDNKVVRLRAGTSAEIPTLGVVKSAIDPAEDGSLTKVVIAGWLAVPGGFQLFLASSTGSAEALLLLERARKEIVDRVELDEARPVGA